MDAMATHRVTITIDGEEYVAVPKAEYARLVGDEDGTVDALAFGLETLGRTLRAAREHAGFSQAELAKRLKKGQSTVSGSESGKVRVGAEYVRKLLKTCGLPPDWKP